MPGYGEALEQLEKKVLELKAAIEEHGRAIERLALATIHLDTTPPPTAPVENTPAPPPTE